MRVPYIKEFTREYPRTLKFMMKVKQEDYLHFLSNCEVFLEQKVYIHIKIAGLNAPRHSSNYLHEHKWSLIINVRFQVVMAASMMMTAFWNTAPCTLIEVDQSFRVLNCFHHQNDEMSVCFNKTTSHYIPECYHLHTHYQLLKLFRLLLR